MSFSFPTGRTCAALTAAVTLSFATAGAAFAGDHAAGVRTLSVPSAERGTELDVTVWYPAASGGTPVTLGENIFFQGTAAMQDAPVAPGQHPVIVLSHGAGLGGRPSAASWLATPLAEAGYIVAAPTHPGNTGPDRSAEQTMKLWQRPADLSRALDALEMAPDLTAHADLDRVGALGLSMGGNSALGLAGARIDPDLLAGYCDDAERNPSLCSWVRMSGVDLRAMDMTVAGRDNSDDRIGFVMAIDPAPADVFAAESLAEVAVPVALVNLGQEAGIPATIRAAPLAQGIPGADYTVIEGATHAAMFPECNPKAAEIAREEGIEDPICPDGTGRPRADLHAQMIDMVTSAFAEAFDAEE
ncbi:MULTISPECIES: alpha/beta hydrolase family protein [Mameliella]|uniref:alpha/beta hydrolase family protein n=1 Tax=Mameliella TaxID=1434019 RepID=UPI000EB5F65F|nr:MULTISPECIES: dienelactone hydrolase [Mameliella]MCR9275878.1 dienelactone hydrolase [Paracoccaceae bacterium]